MQGENEAYEGLRAIVEGYPAYVQNRLIVVSNPKHEPGGKENPNLVIDPEVLLTILADR